MYTEPVRLKDGKFVTKYLWIYGYFYSVVITTTDNDTIYDTGYAASLSVSYIHAPFLARVLF